MKQFDLKSLGVQELNEQEASVINGGFVLPFLLGLVIGGFIYDVCFNPSSAADAFADGYNAAYR
jgi:hypothetical protein